MQKKCLILRTILWFFTGTDKSGECGMTYHKFTVDTTPPQTGLIKAGPDYNMVI